MYQRRCRNAIATTGVSGPAVTFSVDQSVSARAGFTPYELELDASAVFQGEPSPVPVLVNNRAHTLRITFPAQNRASLDRIQNTLLVSPTGKVASLGTLDSIENESGQLEVRRENLQRDRFVICARWLWPPIRPSTKCCTYRITTQRPTRPRSRYGHPVRSTSAASVRSAHEK